VALTQILQVARLGQQSQILQKMNAKLRDRPRIYADFNKWGEDGTSRYLILTCKGTFDDLARLKIKISEGLEMTFYADDSDEAGNNDEIEADGYAHFDESANQWVGIIDWNAIRHSSDRDKPR